MSTEYMKITFSNLNIEHPEWPVSPAPTIYVPYGSNTGQNVVWTTEYAGTGYTDSLSSFIAGGIDYRYHGYYAGGTNYAKLEASNNPDFAIALANGNVSGTYIGNYGETWNIQHRLHVEDLVLSSCEGGDGSVNLTPFEQFGGEPPNAASSPSPTDGETGVRLVLPQLSWSTV